MLAADDLDRAGRGPPVLIVEDEAIIALAEATELAAAGYAPFVARDAGRAREILAEIGAPAALVMDIHLGGAEADGIELAAELRGDRGFPLVFLSSEDPDDPAIRARIPRDALFLRKSAGLAALGMVVGRAAGLASGGRAEECGALPGR